VFRRPSKRRRNLQPGERRLLHDLAVLQRAMDGRRVPARARLEQELGPELARRLQSSLAGIGARAA
jgi:hypothetical protein